MNLEPIIQSEVSQKDKYCILTHIYGIQKNGTEEFIYRAAMEKQTYRTDLWTQEEGKSGRDVWREKHGNFHHRMGNRQPMGICCMSQGTPRGALYQPRGVGWEEDSKGGDICMPVADSC